MIARDILDHMDRWAPEELAEDWDNVGLQVGDDSLEVKGVVLALDLDGKVLDYADENNCNLIITHHPFIFSGLKSINNKSYDGRLIMRMIKEDFIFYAAHTNLDLAKGGVNDQLAHAFNLVNPRVLSHTNIEEDLGYGRIGEIEKTSLEDFIGLVKSTLNIPKLTVYGSGKKDIERVALVGGSGSSFIEAAANKSADILITGDIKYHDGQMADRLGIVLIDGGHFYTEQLVLQEVRRRILELDRSLNVKIYNKPSPRTRVY